MTFFRRFSLGLAVFLMMAIVIGFACVYFYVRLVDRVFLADRGRTLGEQWTLLLADHPFLIGILSLIVIVLLVNCALSLLAMMLGVGPRLSRHLMIDGEGGQIAVALDAVEDFIQRKGSMVSGVKDLKVHAEVSGGLLAVDSRLDLILARDIPSFSREFQGLLRNEITNTLGFKNIKEVRVIIKKMETGEPTPPPVAAAVAPETTAEPEPEVEPAPEAERALETEPEAEAEPEPEAEPQPLTEPTPTEADETPFWRRSDDEADDER